jgi:endonuclease YncB( thermonuclease family)
MTFTTIKGKFTPKFGIPDGDTVRFVADNEDLWNRLDGRGVKINQTNRSVPLRFEGVDAIEKAATKPLSEEATNNMLDLLGHDENNNPSPRGYVLARMTDDKTRRPICFVFADDTSDGDGEEVFLKGSKVKESVNYKQMSDGYAYPLYYNTLFRELREEFNKALIHAKQNNLGYWPSDATKNGVTVNSHSDLDNINPVWPKIWRRLDEYLRSNDSLDNFIEWLEDRNERVDILSLMEERGIQDIVKVEDNKVKLTVDPEDLRVVGQAGLRNRR